MLKRDSKVLRLCASSYLYLDVSWKMMCGNDLNGEHDEWEFTGLNTVGVRTIVGWIFWIGEIWVGIFRVRIVHVGIILGGNLPGGNCPGESYPGREIGLVVSGRNHPGGNFLDGSFEIPQLGVLVYSRLLFFWELFH